MGRAEQEEKVVEIPKIDQIILLITYLETNFLQFNEPVTHKVALGILQRRQPDDDWSQEERIICCR